ncbi:dihydrofolate reductase [Ideonella azotifigens]|uniref:Dihydrofolate reductase n=1 Tax=Ideonella azotifigens TaxID=513160 RepID=A0ABN1JGT5_9BURK|nr:dihydrofolate reductase [Ideonella azotifigens]MCD2344732.1 dihydrofolate reductase [Ideonella azotifigens]
MIRRTLVTLIAVVARNGCVGRDNQLLWQLPEDLAHFRRATQGCPVIMGRKTWDSLPPRFRPLPGRRNVVLSRQPGLQLEGAECATSLHEALLLVQAAPQAFVIGGAQVYQLALPRADQLLLTEVQQDADGDAFFPSFDRTEFHEVARIAGQPADGQPAYDFVTYQHVPLRS